MILSLLLASSTSKAEGARVHLAAGAAQPVAGSQSREFGVGGGAAATVEVPTTPVVSVQGSGGAFALSSDKPPADSTLASKSTGTAVFGTAGVRVRPFGGSWQSGPWIDANGGVGQTGSVARVLVDAHVGWELRSKDGRWSGGPFVGFTQIIQPDDSLRPDDARIGWIGIAIGLGSPSRKPQPARPAPPPAIEPTPTPPAVPEPIVETEDRCPEGTRQTRGGCEPEIRLVGDRIVLDDVIHFEFDSPRVQSRSHPLVRNVAHFIKEHSDIVEVSVEGHADAVGTEEYNQRLSEARADAVRALLVHFGVDQWCLLARGHGESHPIVTSEGAEPRNRRVEFVVKRMHETDTRGEPGYSASREREKP